jgi:hypothetical protein
MTDAEHPPKTLDQYADDRAKLNTLKAPLTTGFTTGIEQDYIVSQKVEYLLGMVGHLLRRIEELEKR